MRIVIVAFVAAMLVEVPAADACTCASPANTCAHFWRVSAVFAGTVRAIEPVADRPGLLAVRFDVDTRGRGVDGDSVVIESAPQNGVNCGYTFQVGQRYVVFASASPDGRLTTSMCSGTKLAAAAADELAFLAEVMGPPQGVRIFGHVRRIESDLTSFRRQDFGGVGGAQVDVDGAGASRRTITGPDGNYDFRGLPAGAYTVTVTPPRGLALAGPPLPRAEHHRPSATVTLRNSLECAELWTMPRTDAQISGVLRYSNGGPAEDERVDLIAVSNAARPDKEIPAVSVRTGTDGRFTFAFVAPGKYLVGLNLRNPPPPSQIDRRAYHPGVTQVVDAMEVTVEPGSRIDLTTFRLPEWPLNRRITGIVQWSDGVTALDAELILTGATRQSVLLDAKGRFTLTLPYGALFTLNAQSRRMVNGRYVGGRSSYYQIGREDRDTELTILLKAAE